METIEGNKLIADGNLTIMLFDGWIKKIGHTFDPDHNGGKNTYEYYEKMGRTVRIEDIPFDIVYHQSWDALMPVVEKIGDLYDQKICLEVFDIITSSIFAPIDDVWKQVIEFIQWYNTTKPQPNATK